MTRFFKFMMAAAMLAALVVLTAAAAKIFFMPKDASPARLEALHAATAHPGKPTAEESDSREDSPTEPPAEKYYVTSEILNVRSGPGTDYSVIGSLSKGMEIKVTSIDGEEGNRWAKFNFEGLTGYAFADYLAKKKQ